MINCSPFIDSVHQRLQRFLVVTVAEQTSLSPYIITYPVKISKDGDFSSHEPYDCCVALPHGAMGLSAVCDCGLS